VSSIRVLLVDDSAVIRGLMNKALIQDPAITVVGAAANGEMAISMAKELKPDIIILDIEMPVMDGITALPQLIQVCRARIIMASTLTQRNAEISMKALSNGASDYLAKPSAKFGNEVDMFYRELTEKIKALGGVRTPTATPQISDIPPRTAAPVTASPAPAPVASSAQKLSDASIKAVAIASSTGGPQALLALFEQLKGGLGNVPIFITQHMPPTFTAILADHLSKAGNRKITEGKDGMEVMPGEGYVAPGDHHMVPELVNGKVIIRTNQGPQENFCRPAADPMLRSLSAIYGSQLLVAVLTGMGQDGMEGAKVVVRNGGHVIAQDEASCVVYGMPKAVVENQLCKAVLPLSEIGKFLIQNVGGRAL